MEKHNTNEYSIFDISNIELTKNSRAELYQKMIGSRVPITEKFLSSDKEMRMKYPKFEISCNPKKINSILKSGTTKSIGYLKKSVKFIDINPEIQINKIIEVESYKIYNSLYEEKNHCCCKTQ